MLRSALVALAVVFLATCSGTGPVGPGPGGGSGGRGISPDACGAINTTPIGRKIYAFLVASRELDEATFKLENEVRGACEEMASVLDVSVEGDTEALCNRVADAIDANLQVSISQEQHLVTRTKPPVCETKVDFAAEVTAECEAKVAADIDVRCSGVCEGTCTGACQGTCATTNADGSCAGECQGTCEGRCTGGCQGYADVDASAECKAAAEVRADVRTECSEPEVEVVTENVTVVDASKLEKAVKAIQIGLPRLLRAAARGQIVLQALGHWVKTGAELVKAGGQVLGEVGRQGACVAIQIAASAAAAVQIQARIDVSIKVSARMSASAGSQ